MWRDWNNNGKDDMGDAFIDYQIYESMSGDNEDVGSPTNFGDVLPAVAIGLLILGTLIILI